MKHKVRMKRTKLLYMLTWAAAGVLLLSGLGLIITSWNGVVGAASSPIVMLLLWFLMSASGIFLFIFAVKKTHRTWITDLQNQTGEEAAPTRQPERKSETRDNKSLDFAATARKLVRRMPDVNDIGGIGEDLMKNLARELEIMSGILYVRKGTTFEPGTSYALASHSEPYKFKEGEGLSGQVARNRQITVLSKLPGDYLEVCSGLGKAEPKYLAIVPLVHNDETIGLLECSGYKYDTREIENMFRIFSRDLMEKLSPNLK